MPLIFTNRKSNIPTVVTLNPPHWMAARQQRGGSFVKRAWTVQRVNRVPSNKLSRKNIEYLKSLGCRVVDNVGVFTSFRKIPAGR